MPLGCERPRDTRDLEPLLCQSATAHWPTAHAGSGQVAPREGASAPVQIGSGIGAAPPYPPTTAVHNQRQHGDTRAWGARARAKGTRAWSLQPAPLIFIFFTRRGECSRTDGREWSGPPTKCGTPPTKDLHALLSRRTDRTLDLLALNREQVLLTSLEVGLAAGWRRLACITAARAPCAPAQ